MMLAYTPLPPGWTIEDSYVENGFPAEVFSAWYVIASHPAMRLALSLMVASAVVSIAVSCVRRRQGVLHRRAGVPTLAAMLPIGIAVALTLLLQHEFLDDFLRTVLHPMPPPYPLGEMGPHILVLFSTMTKIALTAGSFLSAVCLVAIQLLSRASSHVEAAGACPAGRKSAQPDGPR